ncbi:MAG: alkaline phosphatase family protein, partial [Alphaproteobacteria bacterium]|nr:alkaline phosphatase family protein [Alphaproteobacteria bacterium]
MSSNNKIVLLEFNELCWPLLERFMAEGRLPHFKAFFDSSTAYVTEPDVDDPAYLEPWIQWYSLHTGLPYEQHGVFRLTDGPRAGHEDIWHILKEQGHPVASCASMNTRGFEGEDCFYLPDPWCQTENAYPEQLGTFQRFVSRQVQEHTNQANRASPGEYAALLAFLLSHGLSVSTLSAILRQLAAEKLARHDIRWRRAALLDRLQLDLFLHEWRRTRPDFASFFLNSTAHLQHAYWRFMEPEAFLVKPSPEEDAAYRDAVLYGYQGMDQLLRRLFALEDEGVTLVLATGLSQQPFLRREKEGGQRFYRPHDVEAFLKTIGVAPKALEPVMTHQYVAHFPDARAADEAEQRMSALSVGNEQLLAVRREGETKIYFGAQLAGLVDPSAQITADGMAPLPFDRFFYRLQETKSGAH